MKIGSLIFNSFHFSEEQRNVQLPCHMERDRLQKTQGLYWEINSVQTREINKGFSEEVWITPSKLGEMVGKECEVGEKKMGDGENS